MPITITTIFDNYSLIEETITAWGFSCAIQSSDYQLLYDTGSDGKLLLDNMKEMGLAPQDFDHVFISHMHWDHVGGLLDFLRAKPDVHLYLVNSALSDDVKHLSGFSSHVQLIDNPTNFLPGMYSLGDMEGYLNEQAMVLDSGQGLIIVTGCAHPGIVNIVQAACAQFPDKKIHMVMGGFHLSDASDTEINAIIKDLKALNVEKIAPSHCTGDRAIELMREAWGKHFVPSGIGLTMTFSD